MKALLILSLAMIMLLWGCTSTDGVSGATSDYTEGEIHEYQGMNLDPAILPRENSIKGIQQVDIESYRLKVTGLAEKKMELKYEEVKSYPSYERLITLHCVEGWDATILWKGVKLMDIFADAGVQEGAVTVIFKCADGYTTSMALSVIGQRDILLAYEANSATLPPATGYPFIVVAEDKLGYKWARWVEEIELSDNASYQGFWESSGYSNDAEVPEERK